MRPILGPTTCAGPPASSGCWPATGSRPWRCSVARRHHRTLTPPNDVEPAPLPPQAQPLPPPPDDRPMPPEAEAEIAVPEPAVPKPRAPEEERPVQPSVAIPLSLSA